MKLKTALQSNPYDPQKGDESAYVRYLRYVVDGFYEKSNEEVRNIWRKESRKMTKRRVEKEKQQHDCDTCTYGIEEVFTAKQLDTLAQARKIYGGKNQVTVAAEECCELAKELLKAIRYEDFSEAVVHTKKDVLAEVADVLIVLDHILKLYNITASDLQPQIEYKLNRLQQWLNDSNSIEYTTELREI